MIERYTRPEMGRIWSEENKYRQWLEVELATAEALAETGEVPAEAARELRKRASFNVSRIQEIEREVRHDVIAFTTAVAESMAAAGQASASRWLHYGLTSNDVVDTAQALLVRAASEEILKGIRALADVLKARAFEFKDAIQIGRTHGVHAEPITFGLKLALWYDEMQRNLTRFSAAADRMRIAKISGAVGTFGHIGPDAEERIARRLGLEAAPIASQVISRDRHAEYVATLALVAATLEKIALEVRHLQRTEVREAEEPFSEGQKGSSAMPHKRNPVVSEQICGLARVVRSNAQAAFENVALWHERDISHSSAERIVIPDSFLAVDYMLERFTWLVGGLVVRADQMRDNLDASHGLYFSQRLLLALVESGLARDDAYRLVQRHAMRAWDEGLDFRELARHDGEISQRVNLDEVFDPSAHTRHVDVVFERLRALAQAREEESIGV